jgi:hypothetical protein
VGWDDVFAGLAVSRWTEQATGWSIREFVRTARRYRTIEIQAGPQTITAADLSSATCAKALDRIHGRSGAHVPVVPPARTDIGVDRVKQPEPGSDH